MHMHTGYRESLPGMGVCMHKIVPSFCYCYFVTSEKRKARSRPFAGPSFIRNMEQDMVGSFQMLS